MSLFNNIFGNDEKIPTPRVNWQPLTTLDQLEDIIEISAERPVVIFKHSTRCSISRMALKNFENDFDINDKVTPYYLDLLNYKNISSEIADRFNVVHHSPQLLLIKNGKSVYDVSHDGIDVGLLKKKID